MTRNSLNYFFETNVRHNDLNTQKLSGLPPITPTSRYDVLRRKPEPKEP